MKRILALLLAFIMIAGVAGCSFLQPQPEPTEPTEPSVMAPPEPVQKTIHVLLPAAGEGWDADAAAQAMIAVEALQAEGVFLVETATYETPEQQAQLLADIAAKSTGDGSIGVVTMPASAETDFSQLLEANVAYALAGEIPQAAAAGSVANVYHDQYAIGAAAAAYLVSKGLEEGDKVLLISGLSDEEALRTEGFKLYLQGKLASEGEVIADSWASLSSIVYSDMQGTTREDAKNYFVSYMDSSSNAKTKYIAAWDDTYVLGILDALAGEEMDSDRKETFLKQTPNVTGFGGKKELCDLLSGAAPAENLSAFESVATIAHNADILQKAVQSMAAYFAGAVVEQDQPQSILWVRNQTVTTEAAQEAAQ